MDYIKRIVGDELKNKLKVTGAVVIKGPKWCGKTTTAKQLAKQVLLLQRKMILCIVVLEDFPF